MPRLTPLVFTRSAIKELSQTAEIHSQRPQQQWRSDNRPAAALNSNLKLMREFYRMANNDPAIVRQLLIYGKNYIQHVAILRRQQPLQLSPTHPNVMNNINHPLNPSNPLNLALNPGLNLLVQQDIDTQAAILIAEIEEEAENEQVEDTLAQQLVENETFKEMANQEIDKDPELNAHEVLGLSPTTSSEITETTCLRQLAANAPAEDEEATPTYQKIAAAAVMVGFGRHQVHEDAQDLAKLAAPAA